jgi:hypothetical protein
MASRGSRFRVVAPPSGSFELEFAHIVPQGQASDASVDLLFKMKVAQEREQRKKDCHRRRRTYLESDFCHAYVMVKSGKNPFCMAKKQKQEADGKK